MGRSWLSLLLVLIAFDCTVVGDITTDGLLLNDYKGHFLFIVNDTIDNELCLRASFRMDINIYYNQLYNFTVNKTSSLTERLPEAVNYTGSSCSRSDGVAVLFLAWNSSDTNNTYEVSMTFTTDNDTWALHEVDVGVGFYTNASYVYLSTNQSSEVFSSTNNSWFVRSFKASQYYHCDAGQNVALTLPSDVIVNDGITDPSTVRISRAVIYMGAYSNPTSAPCQEDWIAEQEKIVPIIVGGVLAVLLLLIFIAYTVSFIQRKRKEKLNPQYEQLSGKE
ncbi:hypothetical protein EMCRGX_G026858 [Ephydatia muelleri]|eukprot:Em0028g24a